MIRDGSNCVSSTSAMTSCPLRSKRGSGQRRPPCRRGPCSGGLKAAVGGLKPAPTLLCNPLTDRQNISLGVFEPRRLRAASCRDAVHGLDARHVVLLEFHAFRLELGDFGG